MLGNLTSNASKKINLTPHTSGDCMTQYVLQIQSMHIMLITTKTESQEHCEGSPNADTYHALPKANPTNSKLLSHPMLSPSHYPFKLMLILVSNLIGSIG